LVPIGSAQQRPEAICPIAPTGYESESLDRNTDVAIDPSGNVWLADNWKQSPLLNNPDGN
jgi:hypothetical protein